MAVKKHVREAAARVAAMHPGISTSVTHHNRGHYALAVTIDNVCVEVPVSCSPSDPHACIAMVAQMVRRRLRERGVDLSAARPT